VAEGVLTKAEHLGDNFLNFGKYIPYAVRCGNPTVSVLKGNNNNDNNTRKRCLTNVAVGMATRRQLV